MSDGKRNATLKALVDETIVELMPKTSGEQVYLDANTKLSPKVAEMVSAINLRTKKTEHIADVETLNATIDTKVADAIHNSDTKNSELRTYVDENVAAINESMTSSHTAINNAIASANADIALRAKQADVNSAISSLSTSVDNKLAEKANITDVDTKISNLKQEILGDLPVENYDTFTELAAYIEEHKELADSITEAIETKANKTDVNSALDLKANKTDVESALSGKVNTSDLVDPGNATITLIQDGAIKGTFTANQTNNVEITLDANNPTYFPMVGASSAEAGKEGLVPAPAAGKQSSFLRGDGTWALPTDTKYTLESFGVSATAAEINHLGGATSNIQGQLNSKVDSDEFYETIANVDNSVTLTRAEYDALSDAEKDSNTTYYISDEGSESNAFSVPFTSDKYTASNAGDALIEVKSNLEWKDYIQIPTAKGVSFVLPPSNEWRELKIYSTVNGDSRCVHEVNILKDIVVDTTQYIASSVYATASSYDTVIFAFSKAEVTVDNVVRDGLTEGIDCSIHVYYR